MTNREDIFRGLCHQTKVKVSLDSFIKDIYETQRFGSKYDLAIANVNKFYNYPGRNNKLVIQAVRTQLNKDEDLASEIKSRWPSAIVSIRNVVEGRNSKDISETVIEKRDDSKRQSCLQANARLMIRWDGKTGSCCPDVSGKITVGDANKMHIKDIFQSQEAIRLRKDLKSGKAFESDPCKTCSSFESYSGWKPVWDS